MDKSTDTDLIESLHILGKRKGLILIVTLLCMLAAAIISSRMIPVYETSAKLLVAHRPAASSNQTTADPYQSVLLDERLAKTFSELLNGQVVANEVIKRLKLNTGSGDLLKRITAAPIIDTQLIQVTVKDTNPKRATDITNMLGIVLSERIKDIQSFSSSEPVTFIRLVEPATQPIYPVQPKPALYLVISMLAGLMFSSGLAFLLERLDTSVKVAPEIERLTGLSALGTIPVMTNRRAVGKQEANSVVLEAFRSLRTNIQYFNFDQSTKVILVSSAGPKEGKTTVSANLAIMLAKGGQKVMFIDCDFRKPQAHTVLNVKNEVGLSNILASKVDARGAVVSTQIEGLDMIPSGLIPPNPAEMLGSTRMKDFLMSLRTSYDFIIIDSPPILAVTDAAVVAPNVDGVLLVTRYGQTKKHALISAKAAFEKIGARMLGIVINHVMPGNGYDYNYIRYETHPSGAPARRAS